MNMLFISGQKAASKRFPSLTKMIGKDQTMADKSVCETDGCDKARPRAARGARMKFINSLATSSEKDECIIWPFSTNLDGYGQMKVDGRSVLAHRAVFMAIHGDPPSTKHQCAHLCGNGMAGCVNPSHLIWATAQENIDHKKIHGTHLVGVKVATSKLSDDKVLTIRKMAGAVARVKIAEMFGVAPQTIDRVLDGHSWVHVRG